MLIPIIIVYIFIGLIVFEAVKFGFQVMEDLGEPNVPQGKGLQTFIALVFGIFWIFFCIYYCLKDKEEDQT